VNAKLQSQVILLGGTVSYLAPEEPGIAIGDNLERAWDFWKRKVKDK
jgi:hypothetical protein